MPTVRLTAVEGHTPDEIQAFMEKVTDLCVETLGAAREGVIVHVELLPASRYMRGGLTIEKRRQGAR